MLVTQDWVYLIHRDDRQNRTYNTYLPVVATVVASQMSTDVCKNMRYLGATRHGRCRNLSQFLRAFMYIARSLRRNGAKRRRRRDRKEDERFWYEEERLAPCDRFYFNHGALMAIVCPRHTLLAISLESSLGNRKCRGQRMEVRALNNTMPL